MKIKGLIIAAIFALASLYSWAQNGNGLGGGVRVGINFADYTSSTGTGRAGFVGGAFIDYNISRFGFELGANYSQLGTLNIVKSGIVNNSADYLIDYATTHLLVKYQIFDGFRIFLGPQANFLVQSVCVENGQSNPINYISNFDIGLRAGVGFTFKFGLDISASYTRGFIDMFETPQSSYNSSFNITVGWRFGKRPK